MNLPVDQAAIRRAMLANLYLFLLSLPELRDTAETGNPGREPESAAMEAIDNQSTFSILAQN